jgi:hypothetical protein
MSPDLVDGSPECADNAPDHTDDPMQPRISQERLMKWLSVSREKVRRWGVSCPVLNDKPFTPIPARDTKTNLVIHTFDFGEAREIKTRLEGMAEGRWQDGKGAWWLSPERGWRRLTEVKQRKYRPRLLRAKGPSRRTIARLRRLWERKREQLLPGESVELTRSVLGKTWLSERAIDAFRKWFFMPPGQFLVDGKPARDARRAAEYIGCDTATIYNGARSGAS